MMRLLFLVAVVIGLLALANDFYVVNKTQIHVFLSSKSFFVWANLAEALLWGGIGIGFAARAIYLRAGKRDGWRLATLTALTLICFGITDVVEANTGAWWRPWWLLFWKAACIVLLVVLIVRAMIAGRGLPKTSIASNGAGRKC